MPKVVVQNPPSVGDPVLIDSVQGEFFILGWGIVEGIRRHEREYSVRIRHIERKAVCLDVAVGDRITFGKEEIKPYDHDIVEDE